MPELRFGAYRVVGQLGQGAVCTVYEALHEPLGRKVVIKALKPTIAPGSAFAAQLEREARVLADLCHPNVVLFHDFVKTDDRMYLVLEHVDGFTVAELLAATPRLPPVTAAHLAAEIARGLAHAHERGVVHRDVKPSNVLVSRTGDVKIIDFGIAQRERLATADESLVGPSAHLDAAEGFGTIAYMSPEQILGEHVEPRSDVFSLGVLLYEALAGARPFDRGDPDKRAAAQRIRRDPPVPLRGRVVDVPRPLERVVMRALEKNPEDRFPSALAMADELDELVRRSARGVPRNKLLVRALAKARLVTDPTPEDTAILVQEPPRAPFGRAVLGLAVLGLAALVGGGAMQLGAHASRETIAGGAEPLALSPLHAGALRVVATPWAEVFVDGQRIDVTPFARSIPLAPGRHFVTLAHPDAPVEKREVHVVPGETVLLDVAMRIHAPRADDGGAAPDPDPLDGGAP